jgi:outer membrane protein assembly factor BamD
MSLRSLLIFICIFSLISCAQKEPEYVSKDLKDPYKLYEEGLTAFEENNFFFANKKFIDAELNFDNPQFAAKAAIMSSFSLYAINFYIQALESLQRYLKNYPADQNVIYAHYLEAIIFFEQMDDERKDLKPLLKASEKIEFFLKKYPDSDYSTDLKFKKDLIQNQLAAKELYIARYYISVKKWVPAINRLKNILNKYEKTVFVEEALHRLVEINYHLGMDDEARTYAKILGYNYNSSEWYQKSYKILNKEYKIKKMINSKDKKESLEKSFLEKIINVIK